jgi:hypothetical protein
MTRGYPPPNKRAAGLAGDGGGARVHSRLYHTGVAATLEDILGLAAAIDALEFATVSAVLAVHPNGIAEAQQAGLKPGMIQAQDLRTILQACLACRDGDRFAALKRAVRELIHGHYWGTEWTPETLLDFARFRPDGPSAGTWARALVKVYEQWERCVDDFGPLYLPPPNLGELNAIRVGLAIARLARLSGVPLSWLHHQFAVVCTRHDLRTAFRESGV